MNRVKILTVLMCLSVLFIGNKAKAQEISESTSEMSFDYGADIMSRYIWRGTQFGGSSPSIQPGVAVGFKGLEFGAWGAYSLGGANSGQEFDLYLSYTFLDEMLTVTLNDYYFPDETVDYKYYNWKKDATGHVLETSVAFNGSDKVPVSLLFAVNVYGADAIKLIDDPTRPDFNTKDGIQYSSYFELGYAFEFNSIACNTFIGGTINKVKSADMNIGFIGEAGFYGNGPGIVNIGLTASKEIKITDNFSLPLTASVITNPQAEKVFFVFGFSF